jgi:hypothetical protein
VVHRAHEHLCSEFLPGVCAGGIPANNRADVLSVAQELTETAGVVLSSEGGHSALWPPFLLGLSAFGIALGWQISGRLNFGDLADVAAQCRS